MHDYGWSHMGGMWFFWILVLVLIVGAVWWAFRAAGGSPPIKDSPEDILRRRYAKGEIDKEEFEQRLKDLRS